jgi:hypothetical protein
MLNRSTMGDRACVLLQETIALVGMNSCSRDYAWRLFAMLHSSASSLSDLALILLRLKRI